MIPTYRLLDTLDFLSPISPMNPAVATDIETTVIIVAAIKSGPDLSTKPPTVANSAAA